MFDFGWIETNKSLIWEVFRQADLNCFCSGVTLQIQHDWTLDFLVKKTYKKMILIGIIKNPFGEHMLSNVRMLILLINFAWFWYVLVKCCFQIPAPSVRGPLPYNKCRTCTKYCNYIQLCFHYLVLTLF